MHTPIQPFTCQHSAWGSKQQRFRNCKLAAKLTPEIQAQIQQLDQERIQTENEAVEQKSLTEARRQQILDQYLEKRVQLLASELEAGKVLCGHHQKEALAAQAKLDELAMAKETGTYQDPDEIRAQKEQPVDPKDIPREFLQAVERVFSAEPSWLVREILEDSTGPEDWKMGRSSSVNKELGRSEKPVESLEQKKFPCHRSYETLFSTAGTKKKRHLAQESQLIETMFTRGLLTPVLSGFELSSTINSRATSEQRKVFVEFGAGTGGLSRHLQLALETMVVPLTPPSFDTSTPAVDISSMEPFNFVLLDRQKFRSRNQVDYMIRTQPHPVKPRVMRITKDVRDLTLQDLQFIHETEPGVARPETDEGPITAPLPFSTETLTHYVCISKHFCGIATDLALSWLQQQKTAHGSEDSFSLCFATCCHGVCEPTALVSKPYLQELFNTADQTKKRKRTHQDPSDDNKDEEVDVATDPATVSSASPVSLEQVNAWIPWIIKLAGWATLGREEESCGLVSRPGKDAGPTLREDVMPRNQRRVLGKRCKKLLDMSRAIYLVRECGFKQAKAVEYTMESVESGAIIGSM
ncbi:tRNA:m4X modification enzyme [Podila minutissima]|uniref:tRNA:m(4)X modification enzyme TRM13 n=1 Tax=Podila minutissima TaxID=64525 RepID=A0A9P5SRK7_9FUNG|nr:tRNA:m4X modification enzyme [Podila minutissima]